MGFTAKVAIKCEGTEVRDIHTLEEFQGELKALSEENYQRLKNDLLTLGFCEPVVIWKDNILNGHQRIKALKRMETEGVKVPPIPVSIVKAKDRKEAKKIVLALTSQFGKMTSASLLEFMRSEDLDLGDIDDFAFSDIDRDSFGKLFRDTDGLEFDDVELDDLPDVAEGSLPNVDLGGEVPEKTPYIVVYFDDEEQYRKVKEKLSIPGTARKVSWTVFAQALEGKDELPR
jgi:hypothetical protein